MDGYMISVADHDGAHPSTPPRQAGRDHRDSKRMRVTRACDRCKKRKIRCTGLQPCRLCIEANASCTYDAAYTRGRHGAMASRRSNRASPPPQPPSEQQHHERQQSESSRWHAANRQSPGVSRQQQQQQHQSNGDPPDSYSALGDPTQPGTEPLSRASPEPVQTDLEGHYVGPSSGVSFLLRIQKRLDQNVSFPQGSSIFTFGDAPLPYLDSLQTEAPYFDPTLYMMLSRSDTTRLVQRYFDFAVPVDRFLHQQTIETWLDELYETKGKMHNSEDASTRTAVLFMVFALAQAHMSPRPTSDDADLSVRYFLAAHQLLSREQGAIRLASIQARLLQCLWLLSESRINHCWNLFGTAARLAYAIGLHRKRHADRIDRIEVECRRRTFWSAYALDNYLSMALGRPRTFHDDDIDQELPSCVDDHQIYADHIRQGSTHGQSVMLGPVAYAKMSRILSMILRNVYSIHTTSRNDKHAFATIHTKELVEWRADVAHFLDPVTNMPLIPIFQRQKNVLNLAYWHTMILTHRPFLLRNFAQLQNGSRPRRDDHEFESRIDQSVHECLQAAMNITKTVNDMYQGGQLFRAYWFTSYFAFSAAVILYVYTIQKSNEPEESYSGYLAAATRCQDQLSNLTEDGSLIARYCLVLEELRLEALRQTKQGQLNNARSPTQRQTTAMTNTGNGADTYGTTDDGTMVTELGANMTDMGAIGDIYVTPTDSLAEMTGWAQFDAMVSVSMDGFQLNI
ncbi:fungal-specific transcription factor domain-containing protein [Trichoderma sp. SZMC 28012]